MSFAVSPAARADVVATSADLDRRPSRLGEAFEDEFEDACRKIGENPRLHSLVEDGIDGLEIREYYIARFHQRVIYQVSGDDALVVAVIHAARRPGTWHRNLPPETA